MSLAPLSAKLKIVLVVPAVHRVGGIERLGCDLANWLSEQQHSILLLSEKPLMEKATPITPLYPSIQHRLFVKERPTQTQKMVQHFDADIIVLLYSEHQVFSWIPALYRTGIPLLYSEHSNPLIIQYERWNRYERSAFLSASDSIHLLLDQYRNSVPQGDREKIRTIPNPLRFPIAKQNRRERNGWVLLSMGRLQAEIKQLHLLIDAFILLAPQHPQWCMELWGDGPDRQRLEHLVAKAELGERIVFKGTTNRACIQYQRADLFCIPSKFEGFGMTATEAMAHGLPVVGFADCSGVNTIVQHGVNGLLAPEMTAESLAGELSKLMGDHELRNQMSEGAYRRAADFEREKIMLQWEEMILECAQAKGATALDAVLKKPLSFESSAIDRYLLQKAARPFSKRDDSRFDSLLQYVDRNRNSLRVKLPWKLVLSLWRLKQRTALYLKKGAIK